MIQAKGTETGFSDKNRIHIKVGDNIRHVYNGTILTIDKFCKGVSAHGFKHELPGLKPVLHYQDADGKYYTILEDWELTTEQPAKLEGEPLTPADVAELAPARVKDPRKLRKGAKKLQPADPEVIKKLYTPPTEDELLVEQEAKAVAEGVTPEQAHAALVLTELPDEVIADELRSRGFAGELTRIQTLKI